MPHKIGLNTYVFHAGYISKVNHSCDPNCGIKVNETGAHDFVARKDIEVGEEITFDYAMRKLWHRPLSRTVYLWLPYMSRSGHWLERFTRGQKTSLRRICCALPLGIRCSGGIKCCGALSHAQLAKMID